MKSLYSFANHVGGLSTQTVQALTHGFHSPAIWCACNEVSPNPAKFLFSYPSLLPARRGYPDSGSAASVNDRHAPLSFKIKHISVGNQLSSKRVYDFNLISFQNQFGFNPTKVNKNAERCADDQVANDFKIVLDNPEAVNGEEHEQYVRSGRPSKVAFGPKSFIHHLSIPGECK